MLFLFCYRGVSDIITSSDQNTFVTIQGRAGLLTIFDTASGHVKWQRHMADTSAINGACFTNDDPNNLFVCCGNNGDLIMCDTRQPSSPVTPIVTTMCSPLPLVTFSSNNINSFLTFSDKLKLYDIRSLSEPFAVVSMKHKGGTDSPLCVKVNDTESCIYPDYIRTIKGERLYYIVIPV